MSRKIKGYFTVEAAMVLPIVLVIILLIIYMMLFQYNRCLMEQDVGVLALRGRALQTEDNQERIRLLREEANKIYDKKYVAWEREKIGLRVERGKVCIEQRGQITVPVYRSFANGNRVWESIAVAKTHIVSPVSFVRSYHKILGGR